MQAAGVPTARSEMVDNPGHLDAALGRFGPTYVVKDDGLAAGKGVVVTEDFDVARAHAMTLLDGGHPVLLESFLDGPEVSLFCLVDGTTVVPLLPAQDFKRVGDGDARPEHRRHGRLRPAALGPRRTWSTTWSQRIVRPVVDELADAGLPVHRPALRRSRAHLGRARRSSSSTPASATRRPRPCSHCWTPRWPACCYAAATGTLAQQPPLRLAAGRRGDRGDRGRGLPRPAAHRRRDHRRGGRGRAARRHPPPRGWRGRVVGRPGAVRRRARAPTWPPPARTPTGGWPACTSPARTTAPTSRCAPTEGLVRFRPEAGNRTGDRVRPTGGPRRAGLVACNGETVTRTTGVGRQMATDDVALHTAATRAGLCGELTRSADRGQHHRQPRQRAPGREDHQGRAGHRGPAHPAEPADAAGHGARRRT